MSPLQFKLKYLLPNAGPILVIHQRAKAVISTTNIQFNYMGVVALPGLFSSMFL